MILRLKSLAYQTDLAILQFQGRIEDRGDYVVAESPGNPEYFWGNLLVMKNPPRTGDFDIWMSAFQNEFANKPLIQHVTFGWDCINGEEGDVAAFLAQGFQMERSVILTASSRNLTPPRHHCEDLQIKTLVSDSDWEAAILNQVVCRSEEFKLDRYLPFKRIQMKKYRDMSAAGLGHWFGAFLNGHLVAECGLYVFDGIGRYQAVGTHPDFRRRGICGQLIYQTALRAFQQHQVKTLVMAADPEYHAAKIYESVGFQATQKAAGIYRFPKDKWTDKESAKGSKKESDNETGKSHSQKE